MKQKLFSINKKDLNIDFFSGTGGGGQFRNRHKNCIRIRHKDSGVIVTGQSHRERKSNMREALNNLANNSNFKVWLNRKAYEIMEGKKIEEKVEEQMIPENLKIEFKRENGWEEING